MCVVSVGGVRDNHVDESHVQCMFNKHSVSMWLLNNHINIVIAKKMFLEAKLM